MTEVKSPTFRPFAGQHCETTATGTLLEAIGVELSEPMLFGLGEGLSFIFLKLKTMPLPFVGGRIKPFAVTTNLCRNLALRCRVSETGSRAKAWSYLEAALARGRPVGLQLDCYYLDYFEKAAHFAGHFVAAYRLDERNAWLVDTVQQGQLQCVPRSSLEAARHAKGPMAARARLWTIEPSSPAAPLEEAVRSAIRSNATAYLSPSFKGMGYSGIEKLAASLPKWLGSAGAPKHDLPLAAMLMERGGTGGALFRNLYRDFLAEAKALLLDSKDLLEKAHALFSSSADEWKAVAACIERAGADQNPERLEDAAARCRRIAQLEDDAMKVLARV